MNSRQTLLAHHKLLSNHFLSHQQNLSSYSFTHLFLWQDFFKFDISVIDDCLCVFAHDAAGCFMYYPPLGKTVKKKTIETCFSKMHEINRGGSLTRIENISKKDLRNFKENKFKITAKAPEYCYEKSALISLKGNRYKSQRHAYNQFIKNYKTSFVPYKSSMKKEILALYRRWSRERLSRNADDLYKFLIEDNERVLVRALEAYDFLGLIGRVVVENKKIIGFTCGYPLTKKYFCVLFEITDDKYKGLPTYVFREFCKDQKLEKFEMIDAMDDFGQSGLEKVKMSYHPKEIIESYVATKRD